MVDSSVVDYLEKLKVDGNIDTCLIDLAKLMFCDIPDYLGGNEDFPEDDGDKDLDEQLDDIINGALDSVPEDITDFINSETYKPISEKYDSDSTDSSYQLNYPDSETKDEEQDRGDGAGCDNVLIEFAADTIKYNHEPYIWNVEPGQHINQNTIIAFCKQKNKILPVKSIFSQGVVRKDETDGDFWRCWKTVTSRHIVIDCVKKCQSSATGGVELEYLYNDPSVFIDMNDNLQLAEDGMNLIEHDFPYTLYLNLIYFHSETLSDDEWTTNPPDEKNLPETVFNDFIKNKYIPIKEKFQNDMLNLYGGKEKPQGAILATKGNIEKLKKLANDILKLKNEYYESLIDLYQNFEMYLENIPVYIHADKRETWKFNNQMDFKLYPMSDDSSIGTYQEINGSEPEETISEYFSYLDRIILQSEKKIWMDFKELLKKISQESEDGVDQTEKFKKWIEELNEYFGMCVDNYNQFKIEEIPDEILNSPNNDYLAKTFKKVFKDLAKWPTPDDYFYEVTPEYFKEHYVFLNDDEINKLTEKETYESYNGQGTRLGDENQIIDYIDGDNAYTGFVYDNGSADNNPEDEIPNPYNPENKKSPESLSFNNPYINDQDPSILDSNDDGNVDDPNDLANSISQQLEDAIMDASTNVSYNGDVEADYNDSTPASAMDDIEEENDPTIKDLAYWVKYFSVATLATCMFLATGIPLPYYTCIPLPCIYIPLKVIPVDKVGIVIVIGTAIRGASVNIITLYVNMDSKENSMLLPLTLSLETLKEQFQSQIDKMNSLATNAASLALSADKLTRIGLLKELKAEEAKLQALKGQQTEGFKQILDNFRKEIGEDMRNTLTRLKTETVDKIEDAVDEVKQETEKIVDSTLAIGESMKTTVKEIKTGETKKGKDSNDLISPSIA